MSKTTVTIAGEEWPVRLNFGAYRRLLPHFDYSKVTDIPKVLMRLGSTGADGEDEVTAQGVPADAVTPFIRIVVGAGLAHEKDERPLPEPDFFDSAIDKDLTLYARVIEVLSTQLAAEGDLKANPPGKRKSGGKKSPTSKP